MITMKVDDVVCIEIFGTKFCIEHEGEGFGIYLGEPNVTNCLAYMDGFYVDPENASEGDEEYYARDPIGSIEGLFQLLVYETWYGEPTARTVWRGRNVYTSVADGKSSVIEVKRRGKIYREVVITSEFQGEDEE